MDSITIEKVLEKENLDLALEFLTSKKDSCGIDNIYISEFPNYWNINRDEICRQIFTGEYVPDVIMERSILKRNGKKRYISQMTCTDRLLCRAIYQVLKPCCVEMASKHSHAFQDGKGVVTAIDMAQNYVANGDEWVAELDIENYFDNIPLDKLCYMIETTLSVDRSLMENLIKKYIYCKIIRDEKIKEKRKGIVQGSPLSPLFSNLYLREFDKLCETKGCHLVRFADDINIYAKNAEEAATVFEFAKNTLLTYGLKCNEKKSGVYEALNRKYIGYRLVKVKGEIIAKKNTYEQTSYHNWRESAIRFIDKNYHIVNDGILTQSDYTILFENDDGKTYIPIETTDSINVYSSITLGSNFFQHMSKRRIRIAMFDKYGEMLGSFCSQKHGSATKTMLLQSAIYQDEAARLAYAKTISMAAMHNIRANLRYYKKQTKSNELEHGIVALSEIITQMNEAKEINQLSLIEARGREVYYRLFNEMIHVEEFKFSKRTRRPPRDPLNALISFGNVFLYNRIACEINKTSLDIRIGFIHAANNRAESLNLDLAELFKPLIIDRTIFSLINKHRIVVEDFFVTSGNEGVYLTKAGKKFFIHELEDKIYSHITVGEKNYTYDSLMRNEVQKLLSSIKNDKPYKPYKYTS